MLPRATYEQLKRGEPAAFAAVMRAHGATVRRVVQRFWPGEIFRQEEAMQEIWLHVFNKRDALDLDKVDVFPAWLASVARNKCIDLLRATGAERAARADALADDALADAAAAESPADEVLVSADLQTAARAFAATLKPAWAAFFELCFVQGLDYEEIGRRLGIGKLRCKYMKKVIAKRAREHAGLMHALGRSAGGGGAETTGGSDAR